MIFVIKTPTILASIITGLSLFSPFPENQSFFLSPASATQTKQIIAQTSTITEREIEEIIAELTQAANNQNLAEISKYLAPEITIEMSLRSPTGSQNFIFNRDEYLFYLGESFKTTKNYQQTYDNLEIKVSPNGKTALATLNVTETGIVDELKIFSTSEETILFEIINDRILITSVTANSNLEVR
ncbi:hypothetical protein [Oscillatoria salina]|uniref:hypothetical protein n=1 Tax=Oscillatoria salina TaxID=331517 RepID=UPI0013B9F0AB|nr:hypothetical protein [Oscillatoria salina]MBZ8181207.1 hypothetical protein [Oscillatoria salina IIICB1]NET90777.1 hypothetical protein [Kamptonema sp. SIO1D9]